MGTIAFFNLPMIVQSHLVNMIITILHDIINYFPPNPITKYWYQNYQFHYYHKEKSIKGKKKSYSKIVPLTFLYFITVMI